MHLKYLRTVSITLLGGYFMDSYLLESIISRSLDVKRLELDSFESCSEDIKWI